jgi:anaerobic ribonucleoside-triphosphate reductase activating protein
MVESVSSEFVEIAGVTPSSDVNGPGTRAVVHFQGCTLACPGCFNPDTHPFVGGTRRRLSELATELAGHARGLDGVTISGGEPFQQPSALLGLTKALKEQGVMSVLVFTGYSIEEIESDVHRRAALEHLDALVAGRYDPRQSTGGSIVASANQRAHLLTDRYRPEDLELDSGDVEFTITPDGDIRVTGFPSAALRKAVREMGQ